MNNTKTILLFAILSLLMVCCSKQPAAEFKTETSLLFKTGVYRSYQEAEHFALDAIDVIDQAVPTRSGASRTIASGMCYSKPATKSEPAADSLFYVFNFADEAGFAIIAGNRQVSPIVAVTEQGSYIPGEKTGVDGFDGYMDMVISTFSGLDRGDPFPYSYYEDEIVGTQMPPLVYVRWGQQGVYGQFCSNGRSGCVITAMAQILSYFEKPQSFILSVDMENTYSAGDTLVLNWPLIKQHRVNHSGNYLSCDAVHPQIGALMRELGAICGSTYYPTTTSTNYDVSSVYSQLGYQCSNFSEANIADIKNSLSSCCPVQMTGFTFDNDYGHDFIADGFKDYEVWRTVYICQGPNGEYIAQNPFKASESHSLHINWGWDGRCNGYFAFNSYNSAFAEEYDTEDNNVSVNFCASVNMICGIWTQHITPL